MSHKKQGAGRSITDKQLFARVSEYVKTKPDIRTVFADSVVEHLRSTHFEYIRKPLPVFRSMVAKILDVLKTEKPAADSMEVDAADFSLSSSQSQDHHSQDTYTPTGTSTGTSTGTGTGIPPMGDLSKHEPLQVKKRKLNTDERAHDEDSEDSIGADDSHITLMEVKNTNQANNAILKMYTKNAPNTPNTPHNAQKAVTPGPADGTSAVKKPLKGSERRKQKREDALGTPRKKTKGDGGEEDDKSYRLETTGSVTFADIGGVEAILQDIRELIEYPLLHPELFTHLGVEPPRGILLHGPPGSGKTMLANAIAGELQVPFFKIAAPEIVSGMSGESEAKLRGLFQEAVAAAPSLIFIDEIDAITPKRETAQREMERRIVAQLLSCMDELTLRNTNNKAVLVIGATNRPDAIDLALRRAGRFDREISLGVPDEQARARILQVMTRTMRLSGDFDFADIAHSTPGYVGADLAALAKEAAVISIHRIFNELDQMFAAQPLKVDPPAIDNGSEEMLMDMSMSQDGTLPEGSSTVTPLPSPFPSPPQTPSIPQIDDESRGSELTRRANTSKRLKAQREPLSMEQLAPLCISMADFKQAIKKVQPSSKREGFATVPDISWADIGALQDLRSELKMAVVDPIKTPERFAAVGLSVPAGVLLYGPPGCGKTLLAKAVANESGANFISVKGPELLNKYVGESERAVRTLFERARASAPCVIFFDELDALCPRRGHEGNVATERVVNQLLTELDGLESRRNVFVVAATNRPDIIDPAMLRPGRLDKLLYVQLPTTADRIDILRTVTKKMPISNVDVEKIATDSRCQGFSGADLYALAREAATEALRQTEGSTDVPRVTHEHFEYALNRVLPSVSAKDQRIYDRLKSTLRSARAKLESAAPESTGIDDVTASNGGDAVRKPTI
eukprot:GILJ01010394.1.p1 GENE.GILJ01010394.1~~GILJ01010394.1.p1  ORF type:complete len:911 (+),score=157.01 GILJ01010394.1:68-2800(+)